MPWTPEETKAIQEINEDAWVLNVTVGDDETRNVEFQRKNWDYGGYVTTATCECGLQFEAGGAAGERSLRRWAERHDCKQVAAEGDEGKNPFRE